MTKVKSCQSWQIMELDLVVATRENTAKLGYFVDDTASFSVLGGPGAPKLEQHLGPEVVNPGLGIPFYKTVRNSNISKLMLVY